MRIDRHQARRLIKAKALVCHRRYQDIPSLSAHLDKTLDALKVSGVRINADRFTMRLTAVTIDIQGWEVCSIHGAQKRSKVMGKSGTESIFVCCDLWIIQPRVPLGSWLDLKLIDMRIY